MFKSSKTAVVFKDPTKYTTDTIDVDDSSTPSDIKDKISDHIEGIWSSGSTFNDLVNMSNSDTSQLSKPYIFDEDKIGVLVIDVSPSSSNLFKEFNDYSKASSMIELNTYTTYKYKIEYHILVVYYITERTIGYTQEDHCIPWR